MFRFEDDDPLEMVSKSLNLETFAKGNKFNKNSRSLKKAFANRLKKLEASLEDKKQQGGSSQEILTEINVLREILDK